MLTGDAVKFELGMTLKKRMRMKDFSWMKMRSYELENHEKDRRLRSKGINQCLEQVMGSDGVGEFWGLQDVLSRIGRWENGLKNGDTSSSLSSKKKTYHAGYILSTKG